MRVLFASAQPELAIEADVERVRVFLLFSPFRKVTAVNYYREKVSTCLLFIKLQSIGKQTPINLLASAFHSRTTRVMRSQKNGEKIQA